MCPSTWNSQGPIKTWLLYLNLLYLATHTLDAGVLQPVAATAVWLE